VSKMPRAVMAIEMERASFMVERVPDAGCGTLRQPSATVRSHPIVRCIVMQMSAGRGSTYCEAGRDSGQRGRSGHQTSNSDLPFVISTLWRNLLLPGTVLPTCSCRPPCLLVPAAILISHSQPTTVMLTQEASPAAAALSRRTSSAVELCSRSREIPSSSGSLGRMAAGPDRVDG
jgi:hypothetical protein